MREIGVFFVFAHDMAVLEVVDQFTKRANDWLKQEWREKRFWAFLMDLLPALPQGVSRFSW